jgi:hypothetical protein
MNGAGAWSMVDELRKVKQPLVYCVYLNPMKRFLHDHRERRGGEYNNAGWQGYEENCILVFEPEFKRYVKRETRKCRRYRNDPYLLGYFTDNEMPFGNDLLDRHLTGLDSSYAGFHAAWKWFRARKGDTATAASITGSDRSAFAGYYAETYFSILASAIDKYDPNHLYLGCRFNQEDEELRNEAIFRAAGKYVDIISINFYRSWQPDRQTCSNWVTWSGRPFLISEFYVKGEDTGLPNRSGSGWIVRTQEERGMFYQNFVLALLKTRGCVGWHWFRYQDDDPLPWQTRLVGRVSNKGVVNMFYTPYGPLLERMKAMNDNLYSIIDCIDN